MNGQWFRGLVRELRYPAIDGLRFYAVLLVFQVHAIGLASGFVLGGPLSPDSESLINRVLFFFADGNNGVDIFFVISGFRVGRMVFGREGRFHYRTFVWKRFLRIYPAFLASLLATIGYFWIFDLRRFLGNLLFLNGLPSLGIEGYNWVTWSLFYEFAYYLILPMVLLFSRLAGRKGAALILLGCAIAVLQTEVFRSVSLFAGTILAAFDDDKLTTLARRIPLTAALACYFGLALLKSTGNLAALSLSSPATYYGLLAACVSLLFVKLAFDVSWLSRVASTPGARVLGTISYSFYLWHVLSFMFVLRLIPHLALPPGPSAVILIIGAFALAICVSTVSYFLFEQPYFGARKASTSTGAAVELAKAA